MNIIFLHGLESSPTSSKVRFLQALGHNVVAPELPKGSWEASISAAQAAIDEMSPDVIVGSSRGGAVALNVNSERARLILIAPAYKKYSSVSAAPRNTVIIHSPDDEVISFEDSVDLALSSGATLIPGGINHRMSDPEALEKLKQVLG